MCIHITVLFQFTITDSQLCQVGRALVHVREALLILEDESAFGPHPGRDLERLKDQLRVVVNGLGLLERPDPLGPLIRKSAHYRRLRARTDTFRLGRPTTATYHTVSIRPLHAEPEVPPPPPESSSG